MDLINTGQMVLFRPSPDPALLRKLLQEQFQGLGWVGIDQVEDFVLKDTPFSEAIHLKRLTLRPKELEGLSQVWRPS